LSGAVAQALLERRYTEALTRLTGLAGAVDEFFDQVMVMDENPDVRNNRLALLGKVQSLLGGVADLSRLPG
jgi:glycyl-tRNA synthetase beta chain